MNDCLKQVFVCDLTVSSSVKSWTGCATLLTAMNTGHDGSFGSLHANTAQETVTDDQPTDECATHYAKRP